MLQISSLLKKQHKHGVDGTEFHVGYFIITIKLIERISNTWDAIESMFFFLNCEIVVVFNLFFK